MGTHKVHKLEPRLRSSPYSNNHYALPNLLRSMGSMYGIFVPAYIVKNIYEKQPNVSKYAIHGSYGDTCVVYLPTCIIKKKNIYIILYI